MTAHTRRGANPLAEDEPKPLFTSEGRLKETRITLHLNKGTSARHRIRFTTAAEEKNWENEELRRVLGPSVRMCLFEHVEGSTVCRNLFKHFTLPNGKTVHYYHKDTLHEIVAHTIVKPPHPPLKLADIFQDKVPGTVCCHCVASS